MPKPSNNIAIFRVFNKRNIQHSFWNLEEKSTFQKWLCGIQEFKYFEEKRFVSTALSSQLSVQMFMTWNAMFRRIVTYWKNQLIDQNWQTVNVLFINKNHNHKRRNIFYSFKKNICVELLLGTSEIRLVKKKKCSY